MNFYTAPKIYYSIGTVQFNICLIFFNCAVDDQKHFTYFSKLVNSMLLMFISSNNFIKLSYFYSLSPLTRTLISFSRSIKSVNLDNSLNFKHYNNLNGKFS